MKLILLSILFLLTDWYVFAQNKQDDFKPIESVIRRLQPSGTVYYGDNSNKKIYSKLRSLLNKSVFKSYWDSSKAGVLKLTIEEKKFIQTQLFQSTKIKFSDSLFNNSKRIQSSSLVPLVESINRRISDSINQLPDTLKAKAYNSFRLLRRWAFIFTKPVYIRDRTIAVYYFMYYANSSGEDGLWFYKYKNGQWDKWILVPGIGGAW